MSKSEQTQLRVLKWALGLMFALFIVAGFTLLYQHFFGTQLRGRIQNAARADLDLLYRAQKSFHSRYGFYTTDLASLALAPKFVFYKVGFVKPSITPETARQTASAPGIDPSLKDLDALKAAKPEMKIEYSERTALELIKFDRLVSFCADCTATQDTFKAVAAANLDEDPVLDVWTIDQEGKYDHLVDDLQ